MSSNALNQTQINLEDDLGFNEMLNPQLKTTANAKTQTQSQTNPKDKAKEKPKSSGGCSVVLYVVIVLLIICVVSLIVWIYKKRKDTEDVDQLIRDKDAEIEKLKEQEKLLTKANNSYKAENQELKAKIMDLKQQTTIYESKTAELTKLYNQTLKEQNDTKESETFSRIKTKKQPVKSSEDESSEEAVAPKVKKSQKKKSGNRPLSNESGNEEVKQEVVKEEIKNDDKPTSSVKQKGSKKSHQINPLIDNPRSESEDNDEAVADITGLLN